jgi:undecaprenyl-diphosphatase
MSPLDLDRTLIQVAPLFEHPALTAVFVVLSAWWVKGPLLVALGLSSDLRDRRLPIAAAAATAAMLSASLAAHGLKEVFDRARPPVADPDLGSLAAIPGNPSFPSGHAATAFGAATVIALLCPKLRFWALGLAAAVALSRVYLRVHYPLDVLAGALVGAAVGALAAVAAKRLIAAKRAPRPA